MNVSEAYTLPFVSFLLQPEYAPESPVVFLLDSGASVNCLNSAIVAPGSLRILPSSTCPVGASGVALENLGDIFVTIIFNSGRTYRDKFTLIEDLPFPGILRVGVLQNNNFQILEDGQFVKLGKDKVPRVHSPGMIASIKDDAGKFRCGTKNLALPLSGTQIINQRPPKMDNSYGPDQPQHDNFPTMATDKPELYPICPIFSMAPKVKVREIGQREEKKTAYVGDPPAQGSMPLPADLHSGSNDYSNVESLMNATQMTLKEHQVLWNTLQSHMEAFSRQEDDVGCFVTQDGGSSRVHFEVKDPSVCIRPYLCGLCKKNAFGSPSNLKL